MRSLQFLILLLAGLASVKAATSSPPLRFVSDEAYPPISYFYGTHPKGLGIDLARTVAEQLGRPLDIALLPWADAQAQVRQGQADFLGPMTITPQRREHFDFTAPFYKFEYIFLVQKDARGLTAINDLAGKRVGVAAGGYPQSRLTKETQLTLVVVDDTEQAIHLLREGKIDAYAVDKWVAVYELGLLGVHDVVVAGPPFETRESALAVRKGNVELVQKLDAAMATLIQSGAYQKIVDRWLRTNVVVLSEQEQKEHEQRTQVIGALVLLALLLAGAWILFLRRQIAIRLASEQALKASEERFRLALAATHDVIWDWDVISDMQTWNTAGQVVFGWEDIVSVPQTAQWWYDRVHDGDRERVVRGFHAAIEDPANFHWEGEYRFRRADGAYVDVFDRGNILRDSQGKAVRMIGAMLDITQQKQAFSDMMTSERRFRSLAQSSPSGIWRTSADGANTYVSDRWSEITGVPVDLAIGAGWSNGVHPEDKREIFDGWQAAASSNNPSYRSEFRFLRPDGSIVWVLCLARPEYDESHQLIGWVGTITDINELKQSAAKIQESEQLLQRALDSLPSHIAILDETGVILTVNQRWSEFARVGNWSSCSYGVGESYLVACRNAANGAAGKSGGDSDAAVVLQQLEELLVGQRDVFTHEYNCPAPDGTERWFSMSANRFNHGDSVRILVRHTDFTVRRNLEALQRRLMQAIEASGNTVLIADKNGNISYVNPAFEKNTGYSSAEALGRNPRFLHAEGAVATDFSAMWKSLLSGQTWTGEFRNRRKDGTVLWEAVNISPMLNEQGQIDHYVAVKEDITEKRHMLDQLETYKSHLEMLVAERTAELESTQNRLQLILDTTAEGIVETDGAGRTTFANRAALAMLGYKEAALLGQPMHDTLHHHDYDGARGEIPDCPIKACMEQGIHSIQDNDIFRRADQTGLSVSYSVNQIRQDGKASGIVISFSDNTERKLAELERERARETAENLAKIKSDFLANMSHEIRTPLNGVLGLAQIGYRDSKGHPETEKTFAQILESGKLLLRVINDILDFSKIEAGKLAIELIPIDPSRIAREALGSVAERATLKGLDLSCSIGADVPPACIGDPVRITQILLNLLSNAIKFTSQGEISVQVTVDASHLVYRVSDSGIGMTPDQIERLFTPFEQADSSTTRQFGGTGLGLVISKRLTEMMHGSIFVTSQPDKGSTFELRLPCQVSQITPTESSTEISGRRSLARLRILVAEDNEVNQFVIDDMLKNEGAVVTLVGDGKLAVEAVETNSNGFDLVLMDVQMPVLDGRSATRRIRKLAPHLPVIGQTAHALAEERALCLEAGMIDTLVKPIDHEALVAIILRNIPALSRLTPAPAKEGASAAKAVQVNSVHSEKQIDWQQIERTYAGRERFIAKLLTIALENWHDGPAKLRQAAALNDYVRLREIAHRLKGSVGNLFATSLAQTASQLEIAAHDHLATTPALAIAVARQTEDFLAEIRHHFEITSTKPS
jgi:PAS domain S-box-containing protein